MRSGRYLTLLLCCLAPAGAIPLPCGMDTLSNYLAPSFACTIGDKTFGSFAAGLTAISALGTATPISFTDITVLPGGSSSNPSFSFQAAFDADTASLISVSSVTFTVAYTGFAPDDDPFTQANLFLSDPSVSGLGVITAAEALCENGSFTSPLNPLLCTGIGVNTGLTSNITNANLAATITFATPAVTELGVIKQLTLDSGLGGSATASALNNSYEATALPEPGTTGLFAAGLGLILFSTRLQMRRRRG